MNYTKYLLIAIVLSTFLISLVNCETSIKWNYCNSENCPDNLSREDCLNKLFGSDSNEGYKIINIPDYPLNITVENGLYTFTYYHNESLIQVTGGYNNTFTNYTYPILSKETNLYDESSSCSIIDETTCYLAVICTVGERSNKKLSIALGIILPILALVILITIVKLYKKYKQPVPDKDGLIPMPIQ